MKRIISLIAAAVMAIFSLTSCEDVIDALLNNYTVGSDLVVVGSAKIEHSMLGVGIILQAKDEKTPKDVFTILLSEKQYSELLLKGSLDIKDTEFCVSGATSNGENSLTILSTKIVGGYGSFKGYDMTPVSCDATITASRSSSDHLSLKCRAKVVLSKNEDASQTSEFVLQCNYNGSCPEVTLN